MTSFSRKGIPKDIRKKEKKKKRKEKKRKEGKTGGRH
jgi:hypothetical protein